ncbi:putative disease resistance protein isoform X1 [Cinnamomum micranthum f. kanehirae]|uniref:Putative disease resistance protein isoform X1 n=1 Tax=Cinnamomum micranthum f. kanehirae TaxID=337451 RepID=A0A3S3N998_9MAGN|nr:putative disease resistance protein isoform X1 [Cinnamomum micranthum f. kanehirae]
MSELRRKRDQLIEEARDITMELSIAKLNGEKPRNIVINWLNQVEDMEKEVREIEKKLREQNRCWKGLMPDYNMISEISKMASSLTTEGEKLLAERGKLGKRLTFENLVLAQGRLPTSRIQGYTMNKKKDDILECILSKDQNIGIIGIHGMAGTGKTSIMKNINNHLIESKKFDDIIWVNVPQDSDGDNLQMKIAKKLQIDLKGDDEVKQSKILEALTLRNQVLLILDDMWDEVCLDDIGIPHPSETNGCKIVLTTRRQEVCEAMGAHTVKVETLCRNESWELFKSSMGNVELLPEVEDVAKLVAEECCGLPLAILTVGKAMFGETRVRIWERTLKKLREAKLEEQGMDRVFKILEFSYTQLKKPIVKSCFLYCSLYPEDYEIPTVELIDYWLCEGLIDEQETRKDGVDEGHVVLKELIKSSMLELSQSGGNYERVRMHDLIRDLAIRITRKNGPKSIINAGVQSEDLPTDWPEDAERISLMHSHIENLLDEPKCSKLSTLLLQKTHLNAIPESYFTQMCLLKVLDLSGTNIESLPESISNLKNLRALLLRNCGLLKEVSSLSKLDQLRLLDLSETSIQELPAGMIAMVQLQCLNLNGTRKLHLFPAGIISNLSRLEELTMCRSGWTWSEMEGEGATIDEIMNSSSKLVNLDIGFKDLSNFLCYINSGKWRILKSFRLGIGSRNLEMDSTSQQNFIVEINDCYLIDLILGENSLLIPKNTKWLNITYCRMICLCHFTCLLSNTELKGCHIYKCNEMEFLMAESEEECDKQFLKVKGEEARSEMLVRMEKREATRERVLLPNLKYLIIQSAFLLRDLCRGIPSQDAFKNLESLQVDDCNNLKYLFPARLLQQLRSLKHVEVLSCSEMEEIVREEEEMKEARNDDKNTMELSQLQSLKMRRLQKLKSICSSVLTCKREEEEIEEARNDDKNSMELSQLQSLKMWSLPKLKSICSGVLTCNALETVDVQGCPELKKLPFSVHNLPCALRKIIGGDEWWNALKCNDSKTKDYFQLFHECP